jgi:hypothetical protein
MAWYGKVIEIFLSSPSDVQPERDFVRATVQEWNQRRGRDTECIFSLLTWEDSVTSELEDYGQGSINTQIGDTYDVILGLMWGRFGSPTGREASGTLEEFKRALERKREGDPVRISFYFKTADLPFERMDPDQIKKVKEFKKLFQEEGGLTRDFTDMDQLRSQIGLLLEQIARDKDRYSTEPVSRSQPAATRAGGPTPGTEPAVEGAANSTPSEPEPPEELGMLDVTERMETAVSEFTVEMTEWAEQTSILGDAATTAVEELESLARFGNPPASEIRKIIERVTARLESNAKFAEDRSGNVTRLMREIMALIDARIQLLSDFTVTTEQRQDSLKELVEMASAIHMALKNTRGLVDTIGQLPRMSVKFNLARRRVVEAYEPFLRELEKSSIAVGKAIAAMKRALPDEDAKQPVRRPAGSPTQRRSPPSNSKRNNRRRKGKPPPK